MWPLTSIEIWKFLLPTVSVGDPAAKRQLPFGWNRLHTRRLVSQLTMFHKIHYHLVNIHIPQIISPATFIGKHDHQLKYAIPLATIDSYELSLYPRSLRLWNQLPSTAVFAASPAAFQAITLPAVINNNNNNNNNNGYF